MSIKNPSLSRVKLKAKKGKGVSAKAMISAINKGGTLTNFRRKAAGG